jgi:hypothetical protein
LTITVLQFSALRALLFNQVSHALSPADSVLTNTLNRNLIHNKKRNRLGAKTADKVAYIHVNMRILERGDQDPRSWYELPTTGLVEFEEDAQEAHNQPSWALAA